MFSGYLQSFAMNMGFTPYMQNQKFCVIFLFIGKSTDIINVIFLLVERYKVFPC